MTGGAALYERIAKSSAVYSVAIFAPTLASLVMLPVYTRFLSPADYGVIDLLEITRNLFSLLVGGRFAEALFYFYANARDEDEQKAVVSTALMGAVFVGAFGAGLGCLCSPWLSLLVFQSAHWTPYLRLSFLAFGLSLPMEVGFAWLRARDFASRYVVTAVLRLAFNVFFVATLLVAFHKGVAGVLWGIVLANTVMALVMSVPCAVAVSLRFVGSVFWKLIRFTVPIGFSGIALFIIHSGDRFFLQRNVSLTELGIYSLAYKVGMLVSLPQAAFGQFWAGQIYFVIRGEDALRRFARINTYVMTVAAFSGVCISIFAAPLIRTFTTAKFWPCLPYVPWIVAAYVLRSQADYLRGAFYIHGKPGLDAWLNGIAAGFCLVAYAILIPAFHLWGAVAATGLTFALLLALSWFRIRKLDAFWIEHARLFKLLLAAAATTIAGTLRISLPLWECWAVAVICAFAFPLALWLTGFVAPAEKIYLLSFWRRFSHARTARLEQTDYNA